METIYAGMVCGVAVLGLCAVAIGATPEPPAFQYEPIHKRNVFGLTNPSPRAELVQPPPLPRLMLTGITTILGDKRALLKALPPGLPNNASDPAKEILLMLTEGQREGDIEVLQIDEKNGVVKVNNSGTVMLLTFEKDGPKPPQAAPPVTPGARVHLGGVRVPGVSPGPAPNLPVPPPTAYVRTGPPAVPGYTSP